MRLEFATAAKLCESPIEQSLLAALLWEFEGFCGSVSTLKDSDAAVRVLPQTSAGVGHYRIDLAIVITYRTHGFGFDVKIAVECDGHDFHERTKEQAARDKRRDRELQLGGWRVLRFTGSEIWRDAELCAEQVFSLAAHAAIEVGRKEFGSE